MSDCYYIGVDVGTSSVRAALVDKVGQIITKSTQTIEIFEPQPGFYEQSSENIWQSVCEAVKSVSENVKKESIRGLGFDATCSLVAIDDSFKPVTISPSDDHHWNVMMWMDHRASTQAERINATHHPVLKYVGGKISLEMQIPKLLWIKENIQSTWNKVGHFFDLPDFLTWKSTGCLSRSLCSLVCKWTYQANAKGGGEWDASFFTQVGLEDLVEENYRKIGTHVLSPGSSCGNGLSADAARDLGLNVSTPVATSIIDAHAGGLGCLGCKVDSTDECEFGLNDSDLTCRLALICGTSTCHMAISKECLLVPGVWGPYYSAMVPGLWLNEAGQSAAGKLIDHVVQSHPSYNWVHEDSQNKGIHIHSVLEEITEYRAKKESLSNPAYLTQSLHVWPDYHGNRSPVADPSLLGMLSGLSLSSGAEDLAVQYLATIQALAYGTRHILDSLSAEGHQIKLIHACGGLSNNMLYVQAHADATGLPVVIPNTDCVLLGAAILGAVASGNYSSVQEAMNKLRSKGKIIKPNNSLTQYHNKKYKVFLRMLEDQQAYQRIMET